jgi:hypothetical protein
MSPASYLTAPPRVVSANCTTVSAEVRPGHGLRRGYDRLVDWAIYGALIVGFLAVAGTGGFTVVSALRGWRDLKRTRRHIAGELDRLAVLGDLTVTKGERTADATELTAALGRLGVSLARVAVLRAALDEVRDTLRRVAVVYPRK